MERRRVAIIGTGVIGASWATCFLARGLAVTASDPAPDAEERLRAQIARQWAGAEALGLAPEASPERLRFCSDPLEAVKDADFVQENGPERLDFKRTLFAAVDEAAPAHAILASSSSGIPASEFQTACRRPERVLIGHPFNPPHILPLVEVVGGQATSEAAITQAMTFYRAVGKHPIRLRIERPGHLANRLQAALWREAVDAVSSGQADVADVDAAVTMALGPRWALMGPFATFHLGGGSQGLSHFLDHLGRPFEDLWDDAKRPSMTPELKQRLIDGVSLSTGGQRPKDLMAERDRRLPHILDVATGRR